MKIKTEEKKSKNQNLGDIKLKKFKKNLIQFVIGFILLTISFIYLQYNPAERTSVVSGIKIIYQKVKIMIAGFVKNGSGLLEDKYRLEKNYKEIILVFENGKCLDEDKLKELKEEYNQVQKMDLDTYKTQRFDIYENFSSYYQILTKQCGS